MDTDTRNTVVAIAEEVLESAAKKLYQEVVIKAVIKDLVTAIPLIGGTFLNPVITWIVVKVAWKLYDRMKLIGGVYVIKFSKDADRRAYDTAVIELKHAISTGQTTDEAYNEFKKRVYDLVHIDHAFVRN